MFLDGHTEHLLDEQKESFENIPYYNLANFKAQGILFEP